MRAISLLVAVLSAGLLAACERPPVDTVQHGYRGTGMVQVYNPRTLASQASLNTLPPDTPRAPSVGPKASETFKNVQVLGDLSVAEFTRHMASITQWVAPTEGCAYCHNLADLSDDTKYTKVVARRMIEMTRQVNTAWKPHVAATGVTCYTCHRGQPVPQNLWFAPAPARLSANFIGDKAGQNAPAGAVALASLPNDPFTPFLAGTEKIRVGGTTALPAGNRMSIKQTEWTYGLMMHMSKSLGVNCTYCHNTQNFANWSESTPQRVTAWHGIRMVQALNNDYLTPLASVWPAGRLGPAGDGPKLNCATCHQGAYKPLYGASQLADHPELASVQVAVARQDMALPPTEGSATGVTLYFAVGSAALAGDAAQGMAALLESLKADTTTKAVISGYNSASGDPAQNAELAKQRAFAVRDALTEAGIPEARIVLEKPQVTTGNAVGEDASARRVEVALR